MLDRTEKLARLKGMLAQTAPERTLESVTVQRPPMTAAAPAPGVPGSPESAPEFRVAAAEDARAKAQSGLDKLSSGREDQVTPDELFQLEAIVLPDQRPVVFVRDGSYDNLSGIWTSLNAPEVRARLTPLLPSIGRVELPNDPRIPYGGTGFVVGDNLLMTNRHVAKLFTDGLGAAPRLVYRTGDAAINFHREVDSPVDDQTSYLRVVKVEMIHPFWDMALLRVETTGTALAPLQLSTTAPEDLFDHDVVAVGYPARDERNDLALQDRIFERTYNVKRLHPGKLARREQVQSFENQVNAVTHDSSTLGGNSGSAVIDVASGQVVALHFAGAYLKANYAVPSYELARDARVVDVGLNFQGSVSATSDWSAAWARVSGTEGLSSSVAAQSTVLSPATVTFTVPLTITVSLGQPPVSS